MSAPVRGPGPQLPDQHGPAQVGLDGGQQLGGLPVQPAGVGQQAVIHDLLLGDKRGVRAFRGHHAARLSSHRFGRLFLYGHEPEKLLEVMLSSHWSQTASAPLCLSSAGEKGSRPALGACVRQRANER